jgi:HlyD family secretion protein
MKRKRSKPYVWAAALVFGVAGLAWLLRPRPLAVSIEPVTRGSLLATVDSEARTRVKELYVVSAPVGGTLERLEVDSGDSVTAQTVVARILPAASPALDPRSRAEATAAVVAARAAVARAEATEREAKVAVEHADSQLARSKSLSTSGTVPAAEAEHAGHESEIRHRALEAATAAVLQARAELTRARAVVSPGAAGDDAVEIRAPITGQVLRVLRESAGPVAAGTPLAEIGDTSRLEVVADLLSADAASLRPGAAVTVTEWGGIEPIAARVQRIDPTAFTKVSALGLEEQRVRVVADLLHRKPESLGHDYRVKVAVVRWEGKNVVRVPSTALFRDGNRWAVFAVRDGRAGLTPVEIGLSDRSRTAVASGLAPLDEVITQPSDSIEDGTRVVAR